jgi:tetratricopeptide (TPR) repeat protein
MTSENWQGINIKGGETTIWGNTFNFESPKQNPPNNILYSGSANFVGREYELSQLREKLQKPGIVAISAVSGMGGVGKTELAVRYARQHEADYPGGICWLNARESNLAEEIVQFTQLYMNLEVPQELQGRQLSLEQQVEWCWQNWRPTEGLVLVVLDDVTSLKSCRKVLPKANRFRILMTTRLRRLDTNFVEISLDVLSKEDALKLLIGVLGEQDQRVKQDFQAAESLCAWLGYLPLGLELVGRYLVEDPDLSLAEMLQRLKAQLLQDDAIEPSEEQLQDTEMTAKRGVKAAFELSWLELNLHTQHVGELLSLFAPDVIPWQLVEFISRSLAWAEADVNQAKKQLYKLHLMQRLTDRDSYYRIHPLIREFLKVKIAASEQADNLKRAFTETFVVIAKDIPNLPIQQVIQLVKDTIPHLAELSQNFTDNDENLVRVLFGLHQFYSKQGLYKLAEPWCREYVRVCTNLFNGEHLEVANSLNSLALLYQNQGRYAEAEQLYTQALEMEERLFYGDHPNMADSLNNLASLYHDQGRYAEAEPLYIKALEMRKRQFNGDHPRVAANLNNLATLYNDQGRYAEAEPLHIKVLKMTKRLFNGDHLEVATSLNNLALLYKNQGRYAEAEPLYNEALEMTKRLFNGDHPSVVASLGNLAGLYIRQGHYTEAEPLCTEALEMTKRLFEDDHPMVARNLHNLAALYHYQGRYAKAESFYKKALEMRQRLFNGDHPDLAQTLNALAALYHHQGRYGEAEPLYNEALEMTKHLFNDDHPEVTQNLDNLASLYKDQGRYGEAENFYQQALELRTRLLGEEHPDVGSSLNNLGLLYYATGRYTEAEPLLKQGLNIVRLVLGEEHPYIATSLNNLANLYCSMKQYAEAEEFYQQALELRRHLLGEEHPDVASSLSGLASLYHSTRKYAEAERLYQQALKLDRHLLGDEHPYVADDINKLALLYHEIGRYAEAEEFYQQALMLYQRMPEVNHSSIEIARRNLRILQQRTPRSIRMPIFLTVLTLPLNLLHVLWLLVKRILRFIVTALEWGTTENLRRNKVEEYDKDKEVVSVKDFSSPVSPEFPVPEALKAKPNTIPVREYEQFQVPLRYVKLANHLAAREWKEADEETTEILMWQEQSSLYGAVWTNLPTSFTPSELFSIPAQRIFKYCQSIPCEDILIVDQLWVHFSGGRFGLSVQNRVALENGIKNVDNIEPLADRCGWRENNYWIYYEDLTFDIEAPLGHLPANYLFLVDQASGILPTNHVFGKRETFVIWAPQVWYALASRLNLCWRYQQLEIYLRNGQWRKADEETYHVMIQTVGKEVGQWFDGEELPNFPCEHLQIIDHLWVKYSNGKFGFSVQKQIWLECGSPTIYNSDWERFKERVGWLVNQEFILDYDIIFDISAPEGHLPFWGGWNRLGDEVERVAGSVGQFSVIFSLTETCGL